MSDFAINAITIMTIVSILAASSALIITAWRDGGMKHQVLMMKRGTRKIIRQIHKDIHLAIHN